MMGPMSQFLKWVSQHKIYDDAELPAAADETTFLQLDEVQENESTFNVAIDPDHNEVRSKPSAETRSDARVRGITFSHGSYFLDDDKSRANSPSLQLSPSPSPESSSKSFNLPRPTRLRSATLNPRIINREDFTDFTIPRTERKRKDFDLGKLDLKLYQVDLNNNNNDINIGRCCDSRIGRFSCVLVELREEEKLMVTLREFEVNGKPSNMVTGSDWQINPVFTVDLQRKTSARTALNSPKLPSKFANTTRMTELGFKNKAFTWNEPIELHYRHKHLSNYCLTLTLFDENRKHQDLGIGVAAIDFNEVLPLSGETCLSVNLLPFSEPCDFQHGKLVTCHTWNTFGGVYELVILSAVSLKSPRGIDGREFYVKVIAIEGSQEQCTHRTKAVSPQPDLTFNQSFGIPVPIKRIQDMSFVLELHEKRPKVPLANSCIGKVVIGPYMPKDGKSGGCSLWERVITNPNTSCTSSDCLFA